MCSTRLKVEYVKRTETLHIYRHSVAIISSPEARPGLAETREAPVLEDVDPDHELVVRAEVRRVQVRGLPELHLPRMYKVTINRNISASAITSSGYIVLLIKHSPVDRWLALRSTVKLASVLARTPGKSAVAAINLWDPHTK